VKLSLESFKRALLWLTDQALTAASTGSGTMQSTTLVSDPTAVATGSVLGMLGLFGGNVYWHITATVDTEWILLGSLKDLADAQSNLLALSGVTGTLMALSGASNLMVLNAGGAVSITARVTAAQFAALGAATYGTIDLGTLGVAGLAVVDARLTVVTPFAATGAPAVSLYLGGDTLQTLPRLVRMLDAEQQYAASRTGTGVPGDQDPAHINITCHLANGAAMSTLSAGEVEVQVWFRGHA
jgi:hypothetical protein